MAIDERRIESIVAEVLERLDGGATPARAGGESPLGVHPDLDPAVTAAQAAFRAYDQVPLETRRRILAAARETLAANYRALSEVAVEETGLGRVEDKILKNKIVTELTPGTEDLEPVAWTGDHGLTLMERAPYGVIAVITPVTNPSETVINNGLSMIAGGHTAVFCPHPNARKVSNLAVDLINRAARRAGSQLPLLHSVEQPTPEIAPARLQDKGIRLNVVTGGPAAASQAPHAGKKATTARSRYPPPGGGRSSARGPPAASLRPGSPYSHRRVPPPCR